MASTALDRQTGGDGRDCSVGVVRCWLENGTDVKVSGGCGGGCGCGGCGGSGGCGGCGGCGGVVAVSAW
jgi:hypothetical protein